MASNAKSRTVQVLQADALTKQQERTVVDFVQKGGGHFVAVTEDNSFTSLLKSLLNKQLALAESCVTTVLDETRIVKDIQKAHASGRKVLVFIERFLQRKDISFLIQQIKNAYDGVKIVVLSSEVDKQSVAFLHEIGADNFIAKPISLNNLVEKIASTIKPQSKFGEIVDKGKALLAKGAFETAQQLAEKLLQLKPGSAAALMILGDSLHGQGRKQEAVEAYLAAKNGAPLYMEPLNKLVAFYRSEGNPDKELEYLEALDELSPLNVERKVEIGGVHLDMGNKDRAEDVFDSAIKQARKQAAIRIKDISQRIGDIYVKSDPIKAEAYYRKALESVQGPHSLEEIRIYNQIGLTLRRQGRWKEALEEYNKALLIAPEDENIHYNMAMAFSEGKRYAEALKTVRKALGINPEFYLQSAVVCHNIAVVFLKSKETAAGRRFLEESLKLDPDFDSSRKMLKQLDKIAASAGDGGA